MRKDLDRLTLLIERMLDAELLAEAEGADLLTKTEAARQALEAGDTQAARQHIEQVAFLIEAHVVAGALAPADGQAVIQVADGILNQATKANN